MKISEWLRQANKKLDEAGIGTARLDSIVLLEDATSKDRSYLLANSEKIVPGSIYAKLEKQIQRRIKHEPLAYIRAKTEFYGREFFINKDVLEPRPESETMIKLLKLLIKFEGKELTIVDIGTGSGALAVTAKLEIAKTKIIATDINKKCLKVAERNAKKYKVEVNLLLGDLLEPLSTLDAPVFAFLCNLPYVPDHYKINQAAQKEPPQAIFGGKDGLDLYRRLFKQLNSSGVPAQFILTESLPFQHKDMVTIASTANYQLYKTDDFIQLFKKV